MNYEEFFNSIDLRKITCQIYHKYEDEYENPLFAALLRFIVGFRDYGTIDNAHTCAIYFRCLPYDVTQIIRSFWFHSASNDLHVILRRQLLENKTDFDKIYSQWARFWYKVPSNLRFGSISDEEKQQWLLENSSSAYWQQQQPKDFFNFRPEPNAWLNIEKHHNHVYFYSQIHYYSKPIMCKKYKNFTLVKFFKNVYLICIRKDDIKYKFSLCCCNNRFCMHND